MMEVTVEKKDKKNTKEFTWEDKIQALVLLRENNFNGKKTAEEVGVSHSTLKTWKSRYGDKVYRDMAEAVPTNKEYGVAFSSISAFMKDSNVKFIKKALSVKMKALEKLEKLLDKESNTSKVTEAIRLLHEISTDKSPGDSGDEKVVNNYINYIKEIYQIK